MVSRILLSKAKKLNKNLKIIITTNAIYLTRDKIEFLKRHRDHIIIEVSLDGKKESHNINRPQKDKSRVIDSYTMIVKNFPALISSGLYSRISMVVSPHTAKDLLENFGHLLELGFNKIWLMLSCGVLWKNADIEEFRNQLQKIEKILSANQNRENTLHEFTRLVCPVPDEQRINR